MVNVLSSHLYAKWHKDVILLIKYENMTNMNLNIFTIYLSNKHGIKNNLYIKKYKKIAISLEIKIQIFLFFLT
jgi:hypothetical protein